MTNLNILIPVQIQKIDKLCKQDRKTFNKAKITSKQENKDQLKFCF